MLYLAPESSIELMRYLRSTNGSDGLGGATVRRKTLQGAINTTRDLNKLDETAQRWLGHVSRPLRLCVDDHRKRRANQRFVSHVLRTPIPTNTFLDLGHGISICAPHAAFAGMAAQVDLIDAVRIGMELCGFYSQWKLPTAFKSQEERLQNPETRSCTFGVPEAMHASQSQGYASRLASRYGAARAQAAARWLADGSASPMETAVYLLLCLPKRLGGYGLPRPVLNPSVTIQTPDGNLERHPDLYWEERNIDVEYNSDEDHSGEWARYRDSKREVQLATGMPIGMRAGQRLEKDCSTAGKMRSPTARPSPP